MKPKSKLAPARTRPPAKARARSRPAAKPAQRPPPRPVTASEARRIAARYDAARRFAGARVTRTADLPGYAIAARATDVWLVYPNAPSPQLGAAEFVAVCARTGRVVGRGMDGE